LAIEKLEGLLRANAEIVEETIADPLLWAEMIILQPNPDGPELKQAARIIEEQEHLLTAVRLRQLWARAAERSRAIGEDCFAEAAKIDAYIVRRQRQAAGRCPLGGWPAEAARLRDLARDWLDTGDRYEDEAARAAGSGGTS
jgi:hypothetical protein